MSSKSDACQHCLCRGDLKSCAEADCHIHDSWYAEQLQETIQKLYQLAKPIGKVRS